MRQLAAYPDSENLGKRNRKIIADITHVPGYPRAAVKTTPEPEFAASAPLGLEPVNAHENAEGAAWNAERDSPSLSDHLHRHGFSGRA